MKLKYLLIAVLAGAALVGCNREPGVEDLKENGKHSYMGFTISTPAMTKAAGTGGTGTFLEGKDFENWINTIYFFFYKDGAYISWGYGEIGKEFTPEDATGPTVDDGEIEEYLHDGSTEKSGVVVMESTMTMPNQVLCVINSRNPNFYRNKPLETVLATLQTGSAESLVGTEIQSVRNATTKPEIDFWYQAGGKPYFVMLTAPMKGKDKNGKDEIKYWTDIPEGAIKESEKAAKDNPVQVYVERMAARLEITNLASIVDGSGFVKVDNLGDDMKSGTDPVYDIQPIAWSVTAVNQKGNVLKNADLKWWNSTNPEDTAPFASPADWLESGSKVANTAYPSETIFPRINWTKDPNYNDPAVTNRNRYPHSARELYDTAEPNELKYYSANEVKDYYQDGATDDANEKDVRQRYAFENTFGKVGQNDPRIPGTMILLTAQAKKHGAAAFVDLYAYLGQVYNFAEYAEHLVGSLDANGFTFYLKDDMTEKLSDFTFVDPTATNYKDPTTLFEVKKATKYINMFGKNEASWKDLTDVDSGIDATKKMPELYNNWIFELSGTIQPNAYDTGFGTTPIPAFTADQAAGYADGYVTLVPKSGVTLYLEKPAHVTDPTVTPACEVATDAQKAQAFLGSVIEPANRYDKGLMYYAIPIEHFGKADDGATPAQLLDGNYGVVRNNLYQVQIGKINSLGHGIDDPDEPIVPGDRKKTLYIAAKINILSWQIASQTADLQE